MKKIELKDLHEEGDLSTIKKSFKELVKGTVDWFSYSTQDEVRKAWEENICEDVVEAIYLCYEIELGYYSTRKTSLRKFCRRELKKMLHKGKIRSFVEMIQLEGENAFVINKNSKGIYTREHILGCYGIVGAVYMNKRTAKQICKVLN